MKQQDYSKIISATGGNFSIAEFELRGKITDIDIKFFDAFCRFRKWHGQPTLITSAFRPGDTGAHGQGLAIDAILFSHWRKRQLTAEAIYNMASMYGFAGVGIYLDWKYTDAAGVVQPAIGLHVDMLRSVKRPARWVAGRYKGKREFMFMHPNRGKFYLQPEDKFFSLEEAISFFKAEGV